MPGRAVVGETLPMRVAQIARLTGTTVRTVRHYHALGLLPVPEEHGGWRDYELSHVARLSRIRWLAQAGVPLSTIARVLEATPTSAEAPASDDAPARPPAEVVAQDLREALTAVEEHLEEVARQRDMLTGLLRQAEDGLTASPTPPRMAAFFDRMEREAPDERTRAAVRHDRDVVDLACYRGQMPPEAEYLFPEADEAEDAATLVGYGKDLESATDAELAEHAEWIVAGAERRLAPDQLRRLAREVDTTAVSSLFRLIGGLDSHSARVAPLVESRFLEAIERWRQA